MVLPLPIDRSFVSDRLLLLALGMLLIFTFNLRRENPKRLNQSWLYRFWNIIFWSRSPKNLNFSRVLLYFSIFSIVFTCLIFLSREYMTSEEREYSVFHIWLKILFLLIFQVFIMFLFKNPRRFKTLFQEHLIQSISVWKLWCIAVLFFICCWILVFSHAIPSMGVISIFIFSFVLKKILLFFRLNKKIAFDNFYLLSYFCITEVFLSAFIVYYLIFYSQ